MAFARPAIDRSPPRHLVAPQRSANSRTSNAPAVLWFGYYIPHHPSSHRTVRVGCSKPDPVVEGQGFDSLRNTRATLPVHDGLLRLLLRRVTGLLPPGY